MEDVIQNAEKLVHFTNTALAHMNYNFGFEDLPKTSRSDVDSNLFLEKIRHNRRRKKDQVLPIQEELEKFENEVKADTNELLSSMDDLLDPEHYLSARKNAQQSKIVEKIQEINQKIESKKDRLSRKNLETEIRKQKPNPIIQFEEDEFKQQIKDVPEKLISTPAITESDKSSRTSLNKTYTIPLPRKKKVSEDLRKKILQTEQVVDRGFQTVRQLNEKLDTLKKHSNEKYEEAPSCDKISFSTKSPKSQDHCSPKSYSTETIKSFECKHEKRKKKKKEKKIENVSVLDMKWSECSRKHSGKKLKLQRLPSLHIRNGLRLQKIPSIDIPPQEEEKIISKSNVAVKNLIYVEEERKDLEALYKKIYGERSKEKLIECAYCGKLIRIFEKDVRSGDIDELLMKCNFDVFDPRIDEFVRDLYEDNHSCKRDMGHNGFERKKEEKIKLKGKKENKIEKKEKVEGEKKDRKSSDKYKIRALGEELSRNYREKTRKIENDYLEFENVLRDIFKKVDESREVFEGTKYFSAFEKSEPVKDTRRLSITKPVVLELKNSKMDMKIQTEVLKADKKIEVEKEFLKRIEELNKKKIEKSDKFVSELKSDTFLVSPKNSSKSEKSASEKSTSSKDSSSEKIKINFPEFLLSSNKIETEKPTLNFPESPKFIPSDLWKPPLQSKQINDPSEKDSKSDTSSSSDRAKLEENSKSSSKKNDVQTDEDYQSDFEVESLENSMELPFDNDEVNVPMIDLFTTEQSKITQNVNKLPTISEKDSEIEKKISSSTVSEIISENINGVVLPEIEGKKSPDDKNLPEEKKLPVGKYSPLGKTLPVEKNLPGEKTLAPEKKVSQKIEKDDEKILNPQPESNFYRKADESFKEVLDQAFEKGASYVLKRQKDILDLNYKATRRKSLQKKMKNSKKLDVESSLTSASDEQELLKGTNHTKSKKPSRRKSIPQPHADQTKQVDAEENKILSKEMFASLKELLDALKSQFAKTEVLAEKLTENIQSKKEEKQENSSGPVNALNPLENLKYVNNIIFNNLQKNRNDFALNRPKSRNIFTQRNEEERVDVICSKFLNLSPKNLDNTRLGLPVSDKKRGEVSPISILTASSRDDKSLSAGEIVRKGDMASGRKKWKKTDDTETDSDSEKNCKPSNKDKAGKRSKELHLSLKKSQSSDSISEGEVPSLGLVDKKYDSSQSIGEVISEQISAESIEYDGSSK